MTETYAAPSFTKRLGPESELILWDVTPSGNYVRDCHAGSLYGLEALEFLAQQPSRHGHLLSDVALAMKRNGNEPSGIEIGFWRIIQMFAVFGAETHDTEQHRAYVRDANAAYEHWRAQETPEPRLASAP